MNHTLPPVRRRRGEEPDCQRIYEVGRTRYDRWRIQRYGERFTVFIRHQAHFLERDPVKVKLCCRRTWAEAKVLRPQIAKAGIPVQEDVAAPGELGDDRRVAVPVRLGCAATVEGPFENDIICNQVGLHFDVIQVCWREQMKKKRVPTHITTDDVVFGELALDKLRNPLAEVFGQALEHRVTCAVGWLIIIDRLEILDHPSRAAFLKHFGVTPGQEAESFSAPEEEIVLDDHAAN